MLKFISVNFEIIGGIFVAILDIKKAGDLVLKQQAQPIERIDKTIRTLLDDSIYGIIRNVKKLNWRIIAYE